MRNLVIVFISLFSFCSGIFGQQKCQLNVGSFNLRYDNDGDEDDSWTHRRTWPCRWYIFMILMSLGFKKG